MTDLKVQIPVDIWCHKDLPLLQHLWINKFVTFIPFLLPDTTPVSSTLSFPSSGNQLFPELLETVGFQTDGNSVLAAGLGGTSRLRSGGVLGLKMLAALASLFSS